MPTDACARADFTKSLNGGGREVVGGRDVSSATMRLTDLGRLTGQLERLLTFGHRTLKQTITTCPALSNPWFLPL
jgi:hypothetical protein